MDTAAVRDLAIDLLKMLVVFGALLQAAPVLVYAERKICAAIQDRIGPNRVGPFGLLQPVADAIKLIFKEDLVPDHVDRLLYCLAPLGVLVPAMLTFSIVPFGNALMLTPGLVSGLGTAVGVAGAVGALGLLVVGASTRGRVSSAWLFGPVVFVSVATLGVALLALVGLHALAGAIPIEGLRVRLQVSDLPVGVLFFLAIGSMSVYGIAMGGWASNNKFSLLGALRSTAQMISYEVTLGLSVILVLMVTATGEHALGTVRLSEIVARQAEPTTILGIPWLGWNAFRQPLAFLLFLIAAFAETNRLPFDLPECEPELVGGYHTEYSSMKFGMFFMGEYLAMVTMSAMTTTLFLGGWHVPGIGPGHAGPAAALASVAGFTMKVGALLFLFIWVRWSIPRFRYDHLMQIGWKVLIPAALLNIVATAVLGAL